MLHPFNDYKEYWETKDGKLIKYSDMADNHLINTYNMLADKLIDFTNRCMSRNEELEPPEWVQNAVEALTTELQSRGLLQRPRERRKDENLH